MPDDTPDVWTDEPVGGATTETPPPETAPVAEGSEAPPAEAPTPSPAPEPPAEDREVLELLAEARLPQVPGETKDQTLRRLSLHWRGRGLAHHSELRQLRETTKEEIQGLRSLLTPFLASVYQAQELAQREAMAARIPDRETDPQGYMLYILEKQEAERAAEAERQRLESEQGEQDAETVARQEQALQLDEQALSLMNEGLGLEPGKEADPELEEAYGISTKLAMRALSRRFPNAPVEQVFEAVQLSQAMNHRMLLAAGLDPREDYKLAARDLRALTGTANGSGQSEAAPVVAEVPEAPVAPQPVPPGLPQIAGAGVSPTVQRLERATTQAQARAAVSPAPAAQQPGPSGLEINIKEMDEDAWVQYALDHPDEADGLLRRQLGHVR